MRWLPALVMMLVSLLSYIDRSMLALLSPTILKETHLSDAQYGWIISSFSIAYMIGNPVWGHLLDRIGLGAGMLAAVALWTAASASHTLCGGFVSFAIARAALGFGEGATFPGGLRTVTQVLRPSERSRGTALVYSGGSLGAVLTPLVVTPVAMAWGWHAAFLATGALGIAWLIVWACVARMPIVRHPLPRAQGVRPRFDDPRLWGFMAAYALGALPLGFVSYAMPVYFSQSLGQTQQWLGHWLWLPPLGWELGYFFWGWLADRGFATSRAVSLLALLSTPLALVPLVSNPYLVLTALFFAMFIASGFVISPLAFATRVFSTKHVGFIAGLGAGSWSFVVAILMPLFGRLLDRHDYSAAFMIAAFVPSLGALACLLLLRLRIPSAQSVL